MITIWHFDENKMYTGSYVISKEDFNEETMTTVPLNTDFLCVKPLFNGTKWIEGATAEEIQAWNDSQIVQSPSELEVLKQEKEILAQSVYDLTTIVELILTGGIE